MGTGWNGWELNCLAIQDRDAGLRSAMWDSPAEFTMPGAVARRAERHQLSPVTLHPTHPSSSDVCRLGWARLANRIELARVRDAETSSVHACCGHASKASHLSDRVSPGAEVSPVACGLASSVAGCEPGQTAEGSAAGEH